MSDGREFRIFFSIFKTAKLAVLIIEVPFVIIESMWIEKNLKWNFLQSPRENSKMQFPMNIYR